MEETAGEKLQLAFDMFEFGLDMQRKKLARLHPNKTPQELEALLTDWLQNPVTAPDGDCLGLPIPPSHFQR